MWCGADGREVRGTHTKELATALTYSAPRYTFQYSTSRVWVLNLTLGEPLKPGPLPYLMPLGAMVSGKGRRKVPTREWARDTGGPPGGSGVSLLPARFSCFLGLTSGRAALSSASVRALDSGLMGVIGGLAFLSPCRSDIALLDSDKPLPSALPFGAPRPLVTCIQR